jgi:hypothetical protein
MDETSYQLAGNFLANSATALLLTSFRRSMALEHSLHPLVRDMQGMSGMKYRYFINNLVGATPDATYLEVGSWGGSTACSAIFGNRVTVTCIDNWTEFGGPKDVFFANINAVCNDKVHFQFIESDYRKVDFGNIGRYKIYLFDGPHYEQDQYDGVTLAQPALEKVHTLIVDDWNWPSVRKGTQRALDDLGVRVLCYIDVRTTQKNIDFQAPDIAYERSEWHNGYFLAVCEKNEP